MLLVDVPSLDIVSHALTDDVPAHLALQFKVSNDSDEIFQVIGSANLHKMNTDSQPHKFVIRGLEVYSGKELWRIEEEVLIKKLKKELPRGQKRHPVQ